MTNDSDSKQPQSTGEDSSPQLDDAVTPISGAHSVPRSARPPRFTTALPLKNWQGLGIVLLAAALFAIALVAFIKWKGPAHEASNAPRTNSSDHRRE
ncbi:MAG: hypothetical protein KDB90_10260 [Planctomycetes bacterium]|nr:hypothetical protein [Planctomycetota bacterium]